MPAAALQGKPGPLATRLADLLAILGASPVRSQCQTEAQPRGSCRPDGAYHHRHSGPALRAPAGRHAPHHDAEAGALGGAARQEIGRAHDGTPVTKYNTVCRLLVEKKKTKN